VIEHYKDHKNPDCEISCGPTRSGLICVTISDAKFGTINIRLNHADANSLAIDLNSAVKRARNDGNII
jgi:hypothetical protein